MVVLHGTTRLTVRGALSSTTHSMIGERPPDPNALLSPLELEDKVDQLVEWWQGKKNVLAITGAGLSTDSGIPDYRGSNGSYHRGHKPMIHQQFMDSEYLRKRYWGRSMVGWKGFDRARPNPGHFALAALEQMMYLGVALEDREEFYEPNELEDLVPTAAGRRLSVITQNVDVLHEQAGSQDVVYLHGRGHLLKCMNCGKKHSRPDFHRQLEEINEAWLTEAKAGYEESTEMRPDGDANLDEVDYSHIHVPNCPHCQTGFLKPDVVFFGDTVPKSRVALCQAAVQNSDGILVVGSSLAVHSAYRHVRAAAAKGTSIAIVNVGQTRAEAEGLANILKVESPASDTLTMCVQKLAGPQYASQSLAT
eukprot:Nitzschia sp. Nitz4//scaffold88_size82704//7824//8996//NITZ4_005281-RA/size82704-processed-gene-0.114-mRNA-1//-1//CDS//3329559461//2527//frame0